MFSILRVLSLCSFLLSVNATLPPPSTIEYVNAHVSHSTPAQSYVQPVAADNERDTRIAEIVFKQLQAYFNNNPAAIERLVPNADGFDFAANFRVPGGENEEEFNSKVLWLWEQVLEKVPVLGRHVLLYTGFSLSTMIVMALLSAILLGKLLPFIFGVMYKRWSRLRDWYMYNVSGELVDPQPALTSAPAYLTKVETYHKYVDADGRDYWFTKKGGRFDAVKRPVALNHEEMAVNGSTIYKSTMAQRCVVVCSSSTGQVGCGAIIAFDNTQWLATAWHVWSHTTHFMLDGKLLTASRWQDASRTMFRVENGDFVMIPVVPGLAAQLRVKVLPMTRWNSFSSRRFTIYTRTTQGNWAESSGTTEKKLLAPTDKDHISTMFTHTASTTEGFSGSPMLVTYNGSLEYLGTHLGARPMDGLNYYYPASLATRKSRANPKSLALTKETDPLEDGQQIEYDEDEVNEARAGDFIHYGGELVEISLPGDVTLSMLKAGRLRIGRGSKKGKHGGYEDSLFLYSADNYDYDEESQQPLVRGHCANCGVVPKENKIGKQVDGKSAKPTKNKETKLETTVVAKSETAKPVKESAQRESGLKNTKVSPFILDNAKMLSLEVKKDKPMFFWVDKKTMKVETCPQPRWPTFQEWSNLQQQVLKGSQKPSLTIVADTTPPAKLKTAESPSGGK